MFAKKKRLDKWVLWRRCCGAYRIRRFDLRVKSFTTLKLNWFPVDWIPWWRPVPRKADQHVVILLLFRLSSSQCWAWVVLSRVASRRVLVPPTQRRISATWRPDATPTPPYTNRDSTIHNFATCFTSINKKLLTEKLCNLTHWYKRFSSVYENDW